MDSRSWWRRLLSYPSLLRYRRSAEHKVAMQGYWSGNVCRFCDVGIRERAVSCPTQNRYCAFREGK